MEPVTRARTRARTALVLSLAALLYFPILTHHSVRVLWAPQMDFPSFYYAARAELEGVSVYDLERVVALARGEGLEERVFPFLYPPATLALFLPLGALPYRAAALAFMALNHAALLCATWLLCGRLLRLPSGGEVGMLALALVYCFTFAPTLETLDVGQTNLLALVCVTGAWLALRRPTGDVPAGVLLALACLLKLYFVFLLGALLLRRRARAVGIAALALAGLALVSLVVAPHAGWLTWLLDVAPNGGYGRVPLGLDPRSLVHPVNQSLAGFVARLVASEAPLAAWSSLAVPLTWLAAGAVTGASAWAVWRARGRPRTDLDDELCVSLLAVYLIAPFSWNHHLVSLVGVALLGAQIMLAEDSGHAWPARAAILLAALLLAWDLPLHEPHLLRGPLVVVSSAKCLAVLTLWVFFVRRLTASGTRAGE